MIYLITGVPGSGKTLLAVMWIQKWKAQGRQVFSDIENLDMTKVGSRPHDGDAPRDWRETPEGCVVVYDEAQGKFPSTAKPGRPNDEVITAMEEHRHSGHDLVFLTQHSTMLHHHIRKLVGQHIHVKRAFGGNAAALFTWGEATDERDGRERYGADKETFKYPKILFRAYQSATVHTHKFRIPRKVAMILGVVATLVGLAGWATTSAIDSFASSNVGQSAKASSAADLTGRTRPATLTDAVGARSSTKTAKPEITNHDVIGGKLRDRLDGARLSSAWRLVGVLESEDRSLYILRGRDGDTTSVPSSDGAFSAHGFDNGVLIVKGPGGRFAVTRYTGPDRKKETRHAVNTVSDDGE